MFSYYVAHILHKYCISYDIRKHVLKRSNRISLGPFIESSNLVEDKSGVWVYVTRKKMCYFWSIGNTSSRNLSISLSWRYLSPLCYKRCVASRGCTPRLCTFRKWLCTFSKSLHKKDFHLAKKKSLLVFKFWLFENKQMLETSSVEQHEFCETFDMFG